VEAAQLAAEPRAESLAGVVAADVEALGPSDWRQAESGRAMRQLVLDQMAAGRVCAAPMASTKAVD